MKEFTQSDSKAPVTFSDAELAETASSQTGSEPENTTLPNDDIYDPPSSYLRKAITKDDYDQQKSLGIIPLTPPKTPIENSFDAFTSALGCALVCAQLTPPWRTKAGSIKEFEEYQHKLGTPVDLVVPGSFGTAQGNLLEVKRMLLTSAVKWADHWGDSLPDGVEKFWLYRDLMREIARHARERVDRDNMLVVEKKRNEVFRYKDRHWQDVMEQDLRTAEWAQWKCN